jgi:hypothetical protein
MMANSGSSTRKPFQKQSNLARNPAARPSYGSATGWYDSLKMSVSIPYESLLERDLLLVLDIDPRFVSFSAQPETFEWLDACGLRRYTPDARTILGSGAVVYIQAKRRSRFARDPDLGGRLSEIEVQCKLRHASHEIWTEDEIRRQPRLSNVRRLRAAIAFLNEEDRNLILGACSALRLPAPLSAVLDALGNEKRLLNSVLALVAFGTLRLDLNVPIDSHSLVYRGTQA